MVKEGLPMVYDNIARLNERQWSSKILSFYWLMVVISIVGQFIALLVTMYYYPEYTREFVIKKIVVPTVIQLMIMLFSVYILRVKSVFSSFVLIISGTLLALVIIVIHPNVTGLQVTLLLPMAISLIYFDKRKLQFSFFVSACGLTSIYLLFSSIRIATTEYEYFSYLVTLFAGYFIFLAILQRGNEILDYLQQATVKEKELIIKNAMMERLSKIDALTNLYNHKTFHEYLDSLVDQTTRQDIPLQLAIIDIDNFKSVNDTFGHSVGDLVLKRVAKAIEETVTEEDIVARYGGEEFAVLLTNKTAEEGYLLMEKVCKQVESLSHKELDNSQVTVSIGLKNYELHKTKMEFFQQADALLYEAKRAGKNLVREG